MHGCMHHLVFHAITLAMYMWTTGSCFHASASPNMPAAVTAVTQGTHPAIVRPIHPHWALLWGVCLSTGSNRPCAVVFATPDLKHPRCRAGAAYRRA
jgi:hypothetical protein